MPPKKRKAAESKKAGASSSKKAKPAEEPKVEEEKGGEDLDSVAEESTSSEQMIGGKKWVITSWNVNGIRAWLKKSGLKYLTDAQPDVMVVQETKCGDKDLPAEVKGVKGYHTYFQATSDREGYAGVGLFSKTKPKNVDFGMGIEKHDGEGRLVTAEFDDFFLIGAYVPNSGRGLPRLKYRQEWDKDFLKYIKGLDAKKPVIYTGDLNVAHEEIDLKNPKTNTKNAGFTKEERAGFTELLGEGFVDSFRHLYPEKKDAYSFWSYMGNARAKNVGWRLDYFVLSKRLVDKKNLVDSMIEPEVMGSDHCPITLHIKF